MSREEQWVGVVSDSGKETVLPYDYLVLCTGAQFVKEPADGAAKERMVASSPVPQGQVSWDQVQQGTLPHALPCMTKKHSIFIL